MCQIENQTNNMFVFFVLLRVLLLLGSSLELVGKCDTS